MARNKKGLPINGWLNIDKPIGMTSTQVIGRVRRILNAQKLGHAGTLDPLATGILPIALGEATKTIQYAQDHDKVYLFTVTWGEERNTDDAEGEAVATSETRPTEQQIIASIPRFLGNIMQTPPKFSAIKIDGERAYALARAGEDIEMVARPVTVYALRLLAARPDSADFEMECGKGTYVRSVARDMGQVLGCFGYVSSLRRTAVGSFSENNAISLDALAEMGQSPDPDRFLLPVETVLDDIPALALTDDEIGRIRQGQSVKFISRPDYDRLTATGADDLTETILATGHGKPVALLRKDGVTLHPLRLFNL
jgi:tRNA pseudouridine55 synthase